MSNVHAFNKQGNQQGPGISAQDLDLSERAFFEAVAAGDRPVVRAMLKTRPALARAEYDPLDGTTDGTSTSLHVAARAGHIRIMADLVAAGALLDARDFLSQTSVMVAAKGGQPRAVKFLLKKGADPNLEASEKFTALMYAARNGCPYCVLHLLDHKADINAVSAVKYSALHFAMHSERNTEAVVRLLLERGIDTTLRDNLGFSAAELGREYGLDALAAYVDGYPAAREKRLREEKKKLEHAIETTFRGGTSSRVTAPKRAKFTPAK